MLKIKPFSLFIVLGLMQVSLSVGAQIKESTEHSFFLTFEQETSKPIEKVNQQILAISDWWHPSHTYSGDSDNLFMDTKTLHCFCEKFDNNFNRHMALVHYQENTLIRLTGGLGPLQSLPVNGVMDFTMSQVDSNKTLVKLTYRVSGMGAPLKQWVGPVESVLSIQFKRLMQAVEK